MKKISTFFKKGVDKSRLMSYTYIRCFDVFEAAEIANASGKDIQSVLDRKKINNHWEDVARGFDVDPELLREHRGTALEFLPCATAQRESDAMVPTPSSDDLP